MIKLFKLSLAKILCLVSLYCLTSCTSVGKFILTNPGYSLSKSGLVDIDPKEAGFEERIYCGEVDSSCLPFLIAEPYQKQDYPNGKSVAYSLHSTGNGVENEISYRVSAEQFNRLDGTALLLHGYGGSKKAMMVQALYFRALGMKVIMPDLFGHGDSAEEFVFAAKEHTVLSKLIKELNQQSPLDEPLLVVGHSMGALPSVNLLINEPLIKGAIVLAPMIRMDLAADQFLSYKSRFVRSLYSDDVLNEVVMESLEDAKVQLSDTDILPLANQIDKPLLTINSDVDNVSPPEYFDRFNGDMIEKHVFKGRSHSSLLAFDSKDAVVIENWLFRHFK